MVDYFDLKYPYGLALMYEPPWEQFTIANVFVADVEANKVVKLNWGFLETTVGTTVNKIPGTLGLRYAGWTPKIFNQLSSKKKPLNRVDTLSSQ